MKHYSLVALTLAAVALAACDSANSVSGPSRQADFSVATNAATGSSTSASRVITSTGGFLFVGSHSLVVAPGAVNQPTLFTMSVVGNNAHVKLQAFQGNRWKDEVNTFSAPVILHLSYAGLSVVDPSHLTIAYLVDGTATGPREYIFSFVDTVHQTVTAAVPHFSDYTIATN